VPRFDTGQARNFLLFDESVTEDVSRIRLGVLDVKVTKVRFVFFTRLGNKEVEKKEQNLTVQIITVSSAMNRNFH